MTEPPEGVQVPGSVEIEGEAGADENRGMSAEGRDVPVEAARPVTERKIGQRPADQRRSPVVRRSEDRVRRHHRTRRANIVGSDGGQVCMDYQPRVTRGGSDARAGGCVETFR